MSIEWSFWTSGTSLVARLACWPIVPGSLRVTIDDGVVSKSIVDDGDGTLSGDGGGTIDYDYGYVGLDISTPLPESGTNILAKYEPVEGGCAEDCSRCATHYLRLDITPGTITGSDDFTIADAWERLFEKINRDVKPIHVEILPEQFDESFIVSIAFRFDIIPADEEIVDTGGFHSIFDDTSW